MGRGGGQVVSVLPFTPMIHIWILLTLPVYSENLCLNRPKINKKSPGFVLFQKINASKYCRTNFTDSKKLYFTIFCGSGEGEFLREKLRHKNEK